MQVRCFRSQPSPRANRLPGPEARRDALAVGGPRGRTVHLHNAPSCLRAGGGSFRRSGSHRTGFASYPVGVEAARKGQGRHVYRCYPGPVPRPDRVRPETSATPPAPRPHPRSAGRPRRSIRIVGQGGRDRPAQDAGPADDPAHGRGAPRPGPVRPHGGPVHARRFVHRPRARAVRRGSRGPQLTPARRRPGGSVGRAPVGPPVTGVAGPALGASPPRRHRVVAAGSDPGRAGRGPGGRDDRRPQGRAGPARGDVLPRTVFAPTSRMRRWCGGWPSAA